MRLKSFAATPQHPTPRTNGIILKIILDPKFLVSIQKARNIRYAPVKKVM